jgi:hypothetical protein
MRLLHLHLRILAVVALAALAVCSRAEAGVFSAGDLAILMQGDGVSALSNTGNQVNIVDISRTGTTRQTIVIPSTVKSQGSGWASDSGLIGSGSASSEGQLSLSPDGRTLMFAGYVATPGAYQVSSAGASTVQRGYGSVDVSGTYTFGGTFGNVHAYSQNNIRGAVTDGVHVWGAGANHSPDWGGTMLGLGNTSSPGAEVQLDSSYQNTRSVKIFGGDLFFSTQKGTDGIRYFSGLPTTSGQVDRLLIATGDNDSANDFAISPDPIQTAGSYVYIADSRTSDLGGGVQRWDWNGSSYTLTRTFTLPGTTSGLFGLAVDFSSHEIFATTPTSVFAVTDLGSAAMMTSIATIPGGDTNHYAFRGISLAPVPEPSSVVLTVIGVLCGLLALVCRRRRSAW